MKISIITVVYNNALTITDAINSVLSQSYSDIEYIIIDGSSTDGTLSIIKEYGFRINKIISEKDNSLYDAMNKGIIVATGEIIGILNSDDYFYDNDIISKVALQFKNYEIDAVIGDIIFVNKDGSKNIRKYSSKNWDPSKFAKGIMPPHPSFFVKRKLFFTLGFYRLDFLIASDFELMVRFLLKNEIKWKYLNQIITKMLVGGVSNYSLKNRLLINKEIVKACHLNGIKTNLFIIAFRYLHKLFEYI